MDIKNVMKKEIPIEKVSVDDVAIYVNDYFQSYDKLYQPECKCHIHRTETT